MANAEPIKRRLAELPRWVPWKEVLKPNGEKSKQPFNPNIPNYPASISDPRTWSTRQKADELFKRDGRAFAGVGIVLGDLNDGTYLCGIDLDTCRDVATGEFEAFAVSVMTKFNTFVEISPSKTGAKLFFYASKDVITAFRKASKIEHGKVWKRAGTNSQGAHPPAIELYLSNRYFTVTGEPAPGQAKELRTVPLADLLWLFSEAGPSMQGAAANLVPFPKVTPKGQPGDEFVALPYDEIWSGLSDVLKARVDDAGSKDSTLRRRINGDFTGLQDSSRSGRDMALGSGLKRAWFSYDDMREVLIAWLLGAGAEKAAGAEERYFERIWDNARVDCEGDGLPSGFYQNGTGVWRRLGGNGKDLLVCGPLEVVCLSRSPEGNGWGKRLQWMDPDGRLKDYVMPSNAISTDRRQIIDALRYGGLYVNSKRVAEDELIDFLNRSDPAMREYVADRPGWSDFPGIAGGKKCFVLPGRTVMPPGDQLTTIRLRTSPADSLPLSDVRGELADWQKLVGALADQNSRLQLAIGMSLAGPLLWLVDAEGGGIHLFGKTSIGKTTALKAAASVWGSPKRVRSWRATDNGLESAAVNHNHSLLTIDEMGEGSPDALGAAVYMLANGLGKSRMQRDTSGRPIPAWLLLFLSTGEVSLSRKLSEDPRRPRRAQAGQEVRLADLAADAGTGFGLFDRLPPDMSAQKLSDMVKEGCAAAYGTAGPAFLERLVADPDGAAQKVKKLRDSFVCLYGIGSASGQVRRVLARFGLIAAAVQLAIEWGILSWSQAEAIAGIGRCFQDWLSTRPAGVGASEDTAIIAHLCEFIGAHGMSRFQWITQSASDGTGDAKHFGLSDPRRIISNRVGFVRSAGDGSATEYLVLAESWKEIFAGFDVVAAAKTLFAQGYLGSGDGRNNTQKISIPGHGRVRCYVVKASIMEGAEGS